MRWHAAAILGDRALGRATDVVPALAARLDDPHPIVRRIAVLSIGYWKKAAAPFHGAIERLRAEPNEGVRTIVEHVLAS